MAEQNVNEPMANEPQTEEKKYTDKDVDAIIDKKFAAWQQKQDKAIAEAVAKVEEAHKLAQMTEKEKLDHEREAERQELATLRAEKAHSEMVGTARTLLKNDGITIPDEIINVLVTDNAETTSAAVKAFSAMYQNAVNEGVKAQVAGSEPKKGSVASTLSKEEIMAEKDTNKRLQLIEENMQAFEDNFNGGKQ